VKKNLYTEYEVRGIIRKAQIKDEYGIFEYPNEDELLKNNLNSMEQELTPKETADELFLEFRRLVKNPQSPFTEYKDDIVKQNTLFAIDDNKATECALLSVNKVIQVLTTLCENGGYDPFETPISYLKEWEQIKQELEKL
jgi:hypothetical protein